MHTIKEVIAEEISLNENVEFIWELRTYAYKKAGPGSVIMALIFEI